MRDVNVITIVGRLSRNAESKKTEGGTTIVRFPIANNYSKKVGENWQEETNFFECVYIGSRAQGVFQYLTKGRQVLVSGELRQQRWEQDGQARSKIEIVVNELQLLAAPQNQQSSQTTPTAPVQKGPETFSDDDDEVIPF